MIAQFRKPLTESTFPQRITATQQSSSQRALLDTKGTHMQSILRKNPIVCALRGNFTSHLSRPHQRRALLTRGIPTGLGLAVLVPVLICQLASAAPSFDPFVDATAAGGTTYAVGSTLTNQFNP